MTNRLFASIAAGVTLCVGTGLLSARPKARPASSGYTLAKTISIPGDEGWDYVGVDSAASRVYVSHGSHVVVLDADTYAIVGDIADTAGVHGIAISADLGRGFTSNGRTNNSTFFDLKTLKPIGVYAAGTNPDAILYEPVTKRVFTFNGRSQDATALDAMTGASLGTIALGGKPEFAQADGNGGIYVNIEDKSELVHLDAKKLTIMHRWPLAPCQEPSGFALASTGDGHLTVVHQDAPDKYTIIENVPTKRSARTMGLDLKTHAIFLPSAEFDAPAAGERRGKMKPGSFAVLVMTKK